MKQTNELLMYLASDGANKKYSETRAQRIHQAMAKYIYIWAKMAKMPKMRSQTKTIAHTKQYNINGLMCRLCAFGATVCAHINRASSENK